MWLSFAVPEGAVVSNCVIASMLPSIQVVEHQLEDMITYSDTEAVTNCLEMVQSLPRGGTSAKGSNRQDQNI